MSNIQEYTPPTLEYLYSTLIHPFSEVLARAECRGIRVDLGKAKELEFLVESKLQDLYKQFSSKYGPLNYNSPADCQYLFIEIFKLKPLKFTQKTHKPVIDKQSLDYFSNQGCVAADEVKLLRKLDKVLNTYIRGYIYGTQRDGFVNVNYNITGTVTGRASSSSVDDDEQGFNSQNLINDILLPDGTVISIRGLFIPRPGYVFVHQDAAQSELRILGWYTKEPVFVTAASEDRDMHSANGEGIHGIPAEELERRHKNGEIYYIELRKQAKNVGFAWIYGAEDEKVKNMLGGKYSKEEIKNKRLAYFRKFSCVDSWKKTTIKLAQEHGGMFFNCYGQRRVLPNLLMEDEVKQLQPLAEVYDRENKRWKYPEAHDAIVSHEESVRQGLNFIIQGTSVQYINYGLVDLYYNNQIDTRRAHLLLQTHDSADNEVEEGYAEEFAARAKEVLELPKLPVDIKMRFDAEITHGLK